MNDVDAWIYFDGPEPERIRPLLDALRALRSATLPPATPEDREQAVRRFMARLNATLPRSEEPAGGEERQASAPAGAPVAPIAPPDAERRGAEDGATVQAPTLDDRRDTSPPEERR
jgi:hypothetical protein